MTKRQAIFLAAKIVFAAAVLGWLFHKVDVGRVWISVRDARRGPVALGVMLCLFTVAIAGWRWQQLLRLFQITLPLRQLLCIVQVGQFFMMFLPGPVGDDLLDCGAVERPDARVMQRLDEVFRGGLHRVSAPSTAAAEGSG